MVTEVKVQNRSGRGIRRIAAAAVAIGLAFTGVAAVSVPAFAAEAPAPISVEIAPADEALPAPIAEEAADPVAVEPVSEVVDEASRPLGLSIFLVSALTVGAGGIAAARIVASRRQSVQVKSGE